MQKTWLWELAGFTHLQCPSLQPGSGICPCEPSGWWCSLRVCCPCCGCVQWPESRHRAPVHWWAVGYSDCQAHLIPKWIKQSTWLTLRGLIHAFLCLQRKAELLSIFFVRVCGGYLTNTQLPMVVVSKTNISLRKAKLFNRYQHKSEVYKAKICTTLQLQKRFGEGKGFLLGVGN